MADEPKGQGQQLLLACFQVPWMKDCVRAISQAKELATAYPSCKFCSVPADTLELQSVSRKHKIEQFPTFILFRGGQEVQRVAGSERCSEQIVRILTQHITDQDVARYEKKKRAREDEERRLRAEMGLQDDATNKKSEDNEKDEIEWVWDVDGTGQSMKIEELGMSLALRGGADDDGEEDEVVWEFCEEKHGLWGDDYDYGGGGGGWTAFPDDLQPEIERQYAAGELYANATTIIIKATTTDDGTDNTDNAATPPAAFSRSISIWCSDMVVKSDLVTGLKGRFEDEDEDSDNSDEEQGDNAHDYYYGMPSNSSSSTTLLVRRRGPKPAQPVPGEPEPSEMQKRMDESMAKYKASEKRHKRLLAMQRRGRDVEAARGTAGLTPNSGVHRWELTWAHEPSREGKGDAVGLVSESFERFGPCQEPCLGGDAELCSVALYASGALYHGARLLGTAQHQREHKQQQQQEQQPKEEDEEAAVTAATGEEAPTFKLDDRVSVRMEDDDAVEGGAASFVSFTGRIAFVNPNNTYAVIFDETGGQGGSGGVDYAVKAEFITLLEPESTAPARLWGRNSRVAVVFDTDSKSGAGVLHFEVDGTRLEDVTVDGVFNKLGGGAVYPAVCLAPFPRSPSAVSAPAPPVPTTTTTEPAAAEAPAPAAAEALTEEQQRAALVDKAVQAGLTAEACEGKTDKQVAALTAKHLASLLPPKYPTVRIVGEDAVAAAAAQAAAQAAERLKKKKAQRAAARKGKKEEDAEEDADEEDEEEEIPIERCVWMYETENGWEQYPKDVSGQLELARRGNKADAQVRVHGRALTVLRVSGKDAAGAAAEPEQRSDSGESSKVRRHVVSEGLRGQWELLSLKFSAGTRMVRGSGALELLNKVWAGNETMNGRENGMGFLYLYTLLQGQTKVKIVSSWSDYSGGGGYGGMYGGGGGGGAYVSPYGGGGGGVYGGGYSNYYMDGKRGGSSSSSSASASDSHRFATLLAQLYTDRRTKSVMSSIINILVRNKQLCTRMPKLADTRKSKKTPVFNAWVDEREPRSPLADLFGQVVPTLQHLKTKRGTIQFPPRPPHPELAPSAAQCVPQVVPATGQDAARAWLRPELADFACSSAVLHPVSSEELAELAVSTLYRRLPSSSEGAGVGVVRDVEDEDEFWEVLQQHAAKMNGEEQEDAVVVVMFHAKWCPTCVTQSPVFRSTAVRTPIVRFVRVDVDECDKLAARFEVQKLPHTVFLSAAAASASASSSTTTSRLDGIRAVFVGGGPKWVVEFDRFVDQTLLAAGTPRAEHNTLALAQHRLRLAGLEPPSLEEALADSACMATSSEELALLASSPSGRVADEYLVWRTRSEMGKPEVSAVLPFDISGHEASGTAVAESMLARMKEDVGHYAQQTNSGVLPTLRCLPEELVEAYFRADDGSASSQQRLAAARHDVIELLDKLRQSREEDARMVSHALPLLYKAANHVDLSSGDGEDNRASRIQFMLRRRGGQEPTVWLEFLYGALLSSQSAQDLLRVNPYLSPRAVSSIFKLAATAVLRANRVGHTSRCIASAIQLDQLLGKALMLQEEEERRASQSTLRPRVLQSAEQLAGLLATQRHYVNDKDKVYDPRFMVFEFVWNLCLRKKQIEIVHMFRTNLEQDVSKVKQMIMGAGKTTVVAPLLALCLSDGKALVLSVVPKALLEMSRTLMRETFAAIMNKRVYTLRFDRSTKVQPGMRRTLENARTNRGIVVATPTTVKSIMLAYIESLEHLEQARAGDYTYEPVDAVAKRCGELGAVLHLFRTGVMLLDEVDLILHPLKSELNFPKGEKFDLDVSQNGERWGLPIHLLDAIFYAQTGRVTAFEARGAALDIIKRLEAVVREGYASKSLQRLPHITLLNHSFYGAKMKPLLAEWAFLWMQKEHLHGIDREEAVRYMLTGAASRSEGKAKELLLDTALQQHQGDGGGDSEEKTRLQAALDQARRGQQLTDQLYEAEEQYESFLSASAQTIADLDAEIALVTRQIKDAEFPRDDSLDNNVVVWYSPSFAPSHSASASAGKLASLRALGALCSELESAGLTVKRCDLADEAAARVRELQSTGHLRCVVVGGGEGAVGCGPDCDENHQGNCLACGQNWGSHSGHSCATGGRGSWPIDANSGDDDDDGDDGDEHGDRSEIAADNVAFVEQLFSQVGQVALPNARVTLFGGHSSLPEALRMSYWRLGVYVADDEAKLQTWCDQVADWTTTGDE